MMLSVGCLAETEPAPAATQDRSVQPVEPQPAKPKLICTKEAVLGSQIKRKRCRTEAQIEADQEESQNLLNMFKREPDV